MWVWVYVWVCGFCNVSVCVGFVMCVCFGNMCTCIYCVLYYFCRVCCIVSFIYIYIYIYFYLFCLYYCKDYCHRVTTQLQFVIRIIIIIIIIINQIREVGGRGGGTYTQMTRRVE